MSARITLLGLLPLLLFILVVCALLVAPFPLARLGIRFLHKRNAERFKPLVFIAAGSLLFVLLIHVVPLVMFLGYGIHHGLAQRHRLDRAIENDLPEIAEACLSLRQYMTNDEDYVSIDRKDPRMPEVIQKIKCRDVGVGKERIEIEMHGGFDHFGIRLEQDQADSNVWQVLRWWEGGDKLLMTITNEHVSTFNNRPLSLHLPAHRRCLADTPLPRSSPKVQPLSVESCALPPSFQFPVSPSLPLSVESSPPRAPAVSAKPPYLPLKC
jgi:hypothetical protein